MKRKPKSINALMAHMRIEKHIQIKGSIQKKKLRWMGYFHGYKGYRYHNNPSQKFLLSNYNELQAIYDFDMELKALFYPQIMFLETVLKNYALEEILKYTKSEDFNDIFREALTDYKSYPINSSKYKNSFKKNLGLRNKIYSLISRDYGKEIVKHYYNKNRPLPIWAIFELISLGEFGNMIECLNPDIRKAISKSVGIRANVDSDGKMLSLILYSLKDLRNAVAHNSTIFDTRFKTDRVNNRIAKYISAETSINNISFNSITDYVILISFLLYILKCPKKEILTFIKTFEQCTESFRNKVPTSIYSAIILTDNRNKLTLLKKYV